MAEAELWQRAQQGNEAAIATVLQTALQSHEITVRSYREGERLKLLLEGVLVPDQTVCLPIIRQELMRLQPHGISWLDVYGRETGISRPAWQVQWRSQHWQAPAAGATSRPRSVPAAANASAKTSPALDGRSRQELRQAARQGDETALQIVLQQAIAHKQLTVALELVGKGLRIHVSSLVTGQGDRDRVGTEAATDSATTDSATDDQLQLDRLASDSQSAIQPQMVATLIDRELLKLASPVIRTVRLWGDVTVEEFAIGDYAQPRSRGSHSQSSASRGMARSPLPSASTAASPSPLLTPDPQTWKTLGIGFALGLVLMTIPLFRVLFQGFVLLVHELGHTVIHWLFGRPAIPTINFLYGGGVTLSFGQSQFLILLIYAAIAFLFILCRQYRWLVMGLVGFTLVYTYCLMTDVNLILAVGMGHGFELLAIAGCLFVALTGIICRGQEERPLYAMLGFFTWLYDLSFSWDLMHDTDRRAMYEGGIGGVMDNDLVILARDYFHVNLSIVAGWLLVACMAMPLLALLLFRYQLRLVDWWGRLLSE